MYYQLTHPSYESDQDWEVNNPIAFIAKKWISGIICPSCGAWAISRRTYRKIIDSRINSLLNKPPLQISDWKKMEQTARQYLEINANERLFPGEVIDIPKIRIKNKIINDFLFAWTGEIVVKEKVVAEFVNSQIDDTSFKKLEIENPNDYGNVDLFILIAKRVSKKCTMKEEYCDTCGRPQSKNNYSASHYEPNLESFDAFSPEENPNVIFVSGKFRKVVENNKFTNISFVPN